MDNLNLPQHLGFIVDGNRRWARERGLPTLEGHRRGFKKVETIASEVINSGVPIASFYVFSTENWNRSPEEVAYLMDLFRSQFDRLARKMLKENIKCLILGAEQRVAPDILAKLREAERITADCTRGTICFCFNYGGHQEIADAATAIVTERLAAMNNQSADANAAITPVTTDEIAAHIYHPEIPPVDMVIRTGGEQRLSNFMLWRIAYAEFYSLKKCWPAITKADVAKILNEYSSRHRRFGR